MTRSRDVSQLSENGGVAVSPITAGKNILINGGFDIWQRGTSFANPVAVYTTDRWQGYFPTNGTVTQETTTVLTGARYSTKCTATSTGGAFQLYQIIETNNVLPLAGKTVTLTAWVAGTVGLTPDILINYSTTVDESLYNINGFVVVGAATVASATTFQKITITGLVPSTAKTLRIGLESGGMTSGQYLIWGGVQLEVGSVATPFSRAGGTIQGELAACQRYYWRYGGTQEGAVYAALGLGYATSSSNFRTFVTNPVKMRTAPSTTLSGTITSSTQGLSLSGFNGVGGTQTTIAGFFDSSTSGATQYRTDGLVLAGSSSGYIEFSSEL